ncbi:ABC transporter ATP-binding protein [Sphingobacteriales bacterium UPWRP_1]|nr:antibiotic ABC transporter ATP-binding protein [Sphingobacteriales bacterium TSM_CSM]PSJ78586.1 ABC transporter ATP-binding protein [Sphingobacteriales bacterium UPWRP_1]
MKNLTRLLQYLRPFRIQALWHVFFNLLSILFSVVSLMMVIPFLRLLFDKQPLIHTPPPAFSATAAWAEGWFNHQMTQLIVQQGKPQALLFVCILVAVIFFFKNLFRYLAMYAMAGMRNGVIRQIRSDAFAKVLALPVSYFTEERKGDVITRLTSDVQEVENSIISMLTIAFTEPLTVLAYLFTMFFISPQLTLFVLLVLPLTGTIIGQIGKTLKRKSHLAQERLGMLLTIIDETIWGMRIVKGFNAQQKQTAKFEEENKAFYRVSSSMLRRRDLSSPLSEFMSISVVALVLYVGGRMVLSRSLNLEAETFIYFIVVFSQIIPPAKSFSTAFYNIQKGLASVERITKILDAPVTIRETDNPVPLTAFNHSIEFKNVCFAYDRQPVLSDINVVLPKGKVLALVGSSGAGKSTLSDLLPRFYDVTEGEILLDGVNIQQYSLVDLRNLMGIVTQEPILFNDTVFNNIAFGLHQPVTQAEVEEAAKIANAHQFISQLENGYQTIIGDRGCKLSGGERQRLTIARAVLKNPPILILDEATSSLDSASEKLVQDALFRLMQNRTSVVIAHRLSTIQFADEIIVLQKGIIAERGTHAQLMSKQGVYKQLVDLQAF